MTAPRRRPGSCRSCWCWSLRLNGGRCQACRSWARHRPTAACGACGRVLPVGADGCCRVCSPAWRLATAPVGACTGCVQALPLGPTGECVTCAGDRHHRRQVEPLPGGIQLVLGDLRRLDYGRGRAREGKAARARRLRAFREQQARPLLQRDPEDHGRQLRLFQPDCDLAVLQRSLQRSRRTDHGQKLAHVRAEVRAYGEARGWRVGILRQVSRAVDLVLSLRHPGDLLVDGADLALLGPLGLPAARTREFLAAWGMLQPDPTPPDRFGDWLEAQLAGLAADYREPLRAWCQAQTASGGRSRVVLPATQRSYLARVLPACAAWAAAGTPLGAVTTDDLYAALEGLQGHRRSDVIVAFRSLFATLKAHKVIFHDPARQLRHGLRPQDATPALPTQALAELLAGADRPQDRLALLLIGVHAIPAHRLRHLTVGDVDLGLGRLRVNGRRRRLDAVTLVALRAWLLERQRRWPNTANPHLFLASTSHYGHAPVASGYFKAILQRYQVGSRQLRRSRLQADAEATLDPLRLARFYDVDPTSALAYVRAAKAATAETET